MALSAIPGLDVTDLGPIQSADADAKAYAQRMRPSRGLSVVASETAQATRPPNALSRAVNRVAGPVKTAATGTANVIKSGAGGLSTAAKLASPAALPLAAGAALNAADTYVRDKMPAPTGESYIQPPNVFGGTIPGAPEPGSVVPITPDSRVVRKPLGFGPDNEFTRNVANTLNALPVGPGRLSAPFTATKNAATEGRALATVPSLQRSYEVGTGANAAKNLSAPARVADSAALTIRGAQAADAARSEGGLPDLPGMTGPQDGSDGRFARMNPIIDRSAYLAGGGKNGSLPTDLSMLDKGSVYKTVDPKTGRTVYSGVDVKENASIVNGRGEKTGALNNDLRGQGVQVLDANGRPTGVFTAAGGASSTPTRSLAPTGAPALPVSQSFGDGGITAGTASGGLGGFNTSSKPDLNAQLQTQLGEALRLGKSAGTPRERATGLRQAEALSNIMAGMQTAQGRDATSLEGQRISGEYGLRSAQIQAGASGRAAMLEYMQKQADRQAVAEAYRRAGGRPEVAAQIMASQFGMLDNAGKTLGTAATLQGLSAQGDTQARARSDDLDNLFKSTSLRTNAQGQQEFDPVSARVKGDVLRRLMPDFATSTDPASKERAQLQAELLGGIYSKINSGNYTGLDKLLGTEKKSDELLPELKGAQLKQYGRINMTAGVSGRDYGLTLPGTTQEINVGQLSKRQLELLDDMIKNGVNLPRQ